MHVQKRCWCHVNWFELSVGVRHQFKPWIFFNFFAYFFPNRFLFRSTIVLLPASNCILVVEPGVTPCSLYFAFPLHPRSKLRSQWLAFSPSRHNDPRKFIFQNLLDYRLDNVFRIYDNDDDDLTVLFNHDTLRWGWWPFLTFFQFGKFCTTNDEMNVERGEPWIAVVRGSWQEGLQEGVTDDFPCCKYYPTRELKISLAAALWASFSTYCSRFCWPMCMSLLFKSKPYLFRMDSCTRGQVIFVFL